jgi:tetratricopeptide (TPR) repeat protein
VDSERGTDDWGEAARQADRLLEEGFLARATAFYKKALRLNPDDEHSLSQLGDIAARQGRLADAREYFRQLADRRRARGDAHGAAACDQRLEAVVEVTGASPPEEQHLDEALAALRAVAGLRGDVDLLLHVAEVEIDLGRDARDTILQALARAPHRHRDVPPLAGRLAALGLVESAYACLEAASDLAVLEGDAAQAVEALRQFLEQHAHPAGAARLTALQALAAPPAARAAPTIAPRVATPSPEAAVSSQARLQHDGGAGRDPDLPAIPPAGGPAGPHSPAAAPAPDLEEVFETIRARAVDATTAGASRAQYQRGLDRLLADDVEGAIADLQAAAREPLFRFGACAQLGRLFVDRGQLVPAVEWLERAAETPAPTPGEGHAVLYDLAAALERLGEAERALAVLIELEADAGGYRDVAAWVQRLARPRS